jgi:signal transduction histidine kinase
VAPALILWSRGGAPWSWTRAGEAFALLLTMSALGWVVFGGVLPEGLGGFPIAFVCLPPLIWAAFRFDQRMAAAASLTLAAVAVWGTVHAIRPPESENLTLLLLQMFLGVVAVTSLALAALVAERKRVESTIRAASEKMRAAMAELEAFSHSISHDLRSPIGAVINFAVLIEQDPAGKLEAEDMRLLGRIRASAESAVRMLDQLVRYMWIERAGAEFEDVDMTSIARQAFAELETGREGNGGVRLALSDLPAARGSPTLLMSVFRNLFSNSLKHTTGCVERRIEVAGVPGARENTYVVADNGAGFDPRLGESLYQPFFRAGAAKDGAGLGLAIVAKIVRRHGGRVWAESDGSSGARFCFTLPSDGGRE